MYIYLKVWWREFPGGPVVRTYAFTAVAPGSTPGQETKILQVMRRGKEKKKVSGIIGKLYFPFYNITNFQKFCDGYCKKAIKKKKKDILSCWIEKPYGSYC